ncbi:hypothetical protein Tco_0647082, partial [Tanacetum coccineum]
MDGLFELLSPVTAAEIQAVDKVNEALKNIRDCRAKIPKRKTAKCFTIDMRMMQKEVYSGEHQKLVWWPAKFPENADTKLNISPINSPSASLQSKGLEATPKVIQEDIGMLMMNLTEGRSVQLNASRPKFNSVRPNINTGRTNINSGRPKVNTVSSNINTVRSRQQEHPLKNMVDRGIFDSGCSGHMTGNKDQLEDFEEFNGGSVTFGGSKGYISGKRRKQMARRGLHTDLDKDDSEDSDEVGKQEKSVTGTKTPINPVPVAMKIPSIATYKIIKQGEKGVYQIVREDGTDVVYINFGAILKDISRDDLTELYRIVMNRYGMDGPENKLEK